MYNGTVSFIYYFIQYIFVCIYIYIYIYIYILSSSIFTCVYKFEINLKHMQIFYINISFAISLVNSALEHLFLYICTDN